MIQEIIVFVIVMAAAVFTAYNLGRKFRKGAGGCGCNGCGPSSSSCTEARSRECQDIKTFFETTEYGKVENIKE